MRSISRRKTPVNVIIHYPKTAKGQYELAKCVACIHADTVNEHIRKLDCPAAQKSALLNEIIATEKKRAGDKTR